MILFRPYSSIKNFLERFTILKIGSFHIRIHKITDVDRSTLFHNHPFNYISIVLRGGYSDRILHPKTKVTSCNNYGFLSVIRRNNTVFHRIESLKGPTTTLFIAYGKYDWKALNISNDKSSDGIFERMIQNKKVWSKKEDGIWFIGNENKEIAIKETRHSIHQLSKTL